MTWTKLHLFALTAVLAISCFYPLAQSQTAPSAAADSGKTVTEYTPPSDNYQKASAYSAAKYRHEFVDTLYAIITLLLVLRWRLGPKYRDWAERVSQRRFVQVLLYASAVLLTLAVLTIPMDIWDEWLSRTYGLSVQTWPSWLTDWLTNQIVMLLVGTILVWILYAVIRRSPGRWWLYFWIASIPVLLIVFFLQPLVIDPLFFKYTPLATSHPELVDKLQQVVHHGGIEIPTDRMFEMNASSKLSGLNASVEGFGASKRAVVWDTTLAKATTPEILFVFGHEMGHYVLLHIPKEIAIDATILLFVLYLGYRVTKLMLARCGPGWGIRSLDDWASLPLLLLVMTVLIFFASPILNTVSRYFEHEADRYGLEVIHGIVPNPGQVAAGYFEKSGEINLADPNPGPFVTFWFFDHPTRPQRVHFVATYDPWAQGETPRYVH